MFAESEFKQALRAYKDEQTKRNSNAFNALRKNHNFFSDVATKQDVVQQIENFTDIISKMDRDEFSNRYVVQSFILEFCRYLDKDFLFHIKSAVEFQRLKSRLKDFTGEIYSANKKFTQNVGLNSVEHLLGDYGILLEYLDLDEEGESSREEGSFWAGNKLW
ncbi:MAG: hypothetical protein ACE5PM_02985 [Candidatus Hydrothermarchaeales archaeon]